MGDCDWITQTKAGTVSEFQHQFHVAANDDAARAATISFTYDESLTFSVSVAQEAFVPVISFEQQSVEATAEGGPVTVAVEALVIGAVENDAGIVEFLLLVQLVQGRQIAAVDLAAPDDEQVHVDKPLDDHHM